MPLFAQASEPHPGYHDTQNGTFWVTLRVTTSTGAMSFRMENGVVGGGANLYEPGRPACPRRGRLRYRTKTHGVFFATEIAYTRSP